MKKANKLLTVLGAFSLIAATAVSADALKVVDPPEIDMGPNASLVPANLPCLWFITHYDVTNNWTTAMVLQNFSALANQYGIIPFNNNGNQSANPLEGALTGLQKIAFVLTQAQTGAPTGWGIVRAQRIMNIMLLFGQLDPAGGRFGSLTQAPIIGPFQASDSSLTCQ